VVTFTNQPTETVVQEGGWALKPEWMFGEENKPWSLLGTDFLLCCVVLCFRKRLAATNRAAVTGGRRGRQVGEYATLSVAHTHHVLYRRTVGLLLHSELEKCGMTGGPVLSMSGESEGKHQTLSYDMPSPYLNPETF